jgi:hypothetical protein
MKYFNISNFQIISKSEARQLLASGFKVVNNIVGPVPMLQKYIKDRNYRKGIDEKFAIKLGLQKLSFDEIREQLMDLSVHEILRMRLVSKEWRTIIDEESFWCRLLKRDHNVSMTENCFNNYKLRSNKYYKIAEKLFNVVPEDEKTLKNTIESNVKLLESIEMEIIRKFHKLYEKRYHNIAQEMYNFGNEVFGIDMDNTYGDAKTNIVFYDLLFGGELDSEEMSFFVNIYFQLLGFEEDHFDIYDYPYYNAVNETGAILDLVNLYSDLVA